MNRRAVAGWLLLAAGVTALAVLTVVPALWSYSRTIDVAHIVSFLAIVSGVILIVRVKPGGNRLMGFVARLSLAVALNLLYWIVVVEPHVMPDETIPFTLMRTVSLVDLPVAIAVLPFRQLRYDVVDVHMQSFPYGMTRFCFGIPPAFVWSHLAVAVPVWLGLLYVPWLSKRFAR